MTEPEADEVIGRARGRKAARIAAKFRWIAAHVLVTEGTEPTADAILQMAEAASLETWRTCADNVDVGEPSAATIATIIGILEAEQGASMNPCVYCGLDLDTILTAQRRRSHLLTHSDQERSNTMLPIDPALALARIAVACDDNDASNRMYDTLVERFGQERAVEAWQQACIDHDRQAEREGK